MSSAQTSKYLDTGGEWPQVGRTLNSAAKYTILEQGREPGKDQWYARCLYEDQATDVTVIVDGEVLRHKTDWSAPFSDYSASARAYR